MFKGGLRLTFETIFKIYNPNLALWFICSNFIMIVYELFKCLVCGHSDNADLTAAMNIKAAVLDVLACGEDALATSFKQEPQHNEQSLVA